MREWSGPYNVDRFRVSLGRSNNSKEGAENGRVNYTTEWIIIRLREVEVLFGQGKTIVEAVRQIGVTEQTHYRWRKKYGGMTTSNTKKYRELEKENTRLKKLAESQPCSRQTAGV